MTYEFVYQGDVPKASTWKANGDGAVTYNDTYYCVEGRQYYELFKDKNPSTLVDSTEMNMAFPGNRVQTVQVTWEPGKIYTFRVRLQLSSDNPSEHCVYYWAYQGAQMTFP